MRKAQKVLIIISVLLMPVLVFLFLKQFGDNKFTLPQYYLEGSPIAHCANQSIPHKIDQRWIDTLDIQLPALFYVGGIERDSLYSDLDNVLEKYPGVHIYQIVSNTSVQYSGKKQIRFPDEVFIQIINCELIMGEDSWIDDPIPYKYILIDKYLGIRGYFDVSTLLEIERLDTELDILLNY